MTKRCPSCHCAEPVSLPCLIQTRFYVNQNGLIIGKVNGCPYEKNKKIFIAESMMNMNRERAKDVARVAAKEVTYEDYKDLWASWYGKNHLLDRNPKEALSFWLASYSSRLSFTHERRCGGGKEQIACAKRLLECLEGLSMVSDNPLGVLPPHWYQRIGNMYYSHT